MDSELKEMRNKITLTKEKVGDITFKNIELRFGTNVQVFKDFNLNIAKGKITAIIGENGSGKSTLISLLQKKYQAQKGSVSIGNLNLNSIDSRSLSEVVHVVPQKIDILTGNVIDNIAVGEFLPDIERIIHICDSIGILEFIKSLPNSFSTHLGEKGAFLSRGQKQKIAIASALYKDPEILVLDEVTSSLDNKSENYIQKTIVDLKRKNKTIIIVTHRLSSVVYADKIVVLEKGEVIEEGTHDILYSMKSHYYYLWQQQLPILEY